MESASGALTASLSAYSLHPAQGGSRAKQQVGGVADGSL